MLTDSGQHMQLNKHIVWYPDPYSVTAAMDDITAMGRIQRHIFGYEQKSMKQVTKNILYEKVGGI